MKLIFPEDSYIYPFSCCKAVKGAKRGAIYDLQRGVFEYVPNDLVDILNKIHKYTTFNEMVSLYGVENKNTLREYFNFLYQKEFLFILNKKNLIFPDYPKFTEKPHHLHNITVDISSKKASDFYKFFLSFIEKTLCQSVSFRFIDTSNISNISDILQNFDEVGCKIFQIIIPFNKQMDFSALENLVQKNLRISVIVLSNSMEDRVMYELNDRIIKIKEDIFKKGFVRNRNISDFMVNYELYQESQTFNSYFNRRCYIDYRGQIYRHENDNIDFGNINDIDVYKLINNIEFQKYWNIKKDNIRVCKDCEYRYMCVDSAMPMMVNGEYCIEEECNYDPYTALWKTKND